MIGLSIGNYADAYFVERTGDLEFRSYDLEEALAEKRKLVDDDIIESEVVSNDTHFEIDIYYTKISNDILLSKYDKMIFVEGRSNTSIKIYVDVYDSDLRKVDSIDTLIITDENGDWFEFQNDDIDGNECYIVVYGRGEYSIVSYERIEPMFMLRGLILIILITFLFSVITILIWSLLLRKYKMTKALPNAQSYKFDLKDLERIKFEIKRYRRIGSFLIAGIYITSILFWTSYIVFFFTAFEANDLFDLSLSEGFMVSTSMFMLMMVFLFILLGLFGYYTFWKKKNERRFHKSYSSLKFEIPKMKLKRIQDRVFLLGNFIAILPQMLMLIIIGLGPLLIPNEYNDLCFLVPELCLAIFAITIVWITPIFFVQRIECSKKELLVYTGPSWLKLKRRRFRTNEIKSIRPIPATLYYELFPGLRRIDGKLRIIKTGVIIQKKNGKIEKVLTSKPLKIIYLLRSRNKGN
jgi:hypothetical protein